MQNKIPTFFPSLYSFLFPGCNPRSVNWNESVLFHAWASHFIRCRRRISNESDFKHGSQSMPARSVPASAVKRKRSKFGERTGTQRPRVSDALRPPVSLLLLHTVKGQKSSALSAPITLRGVSSGRCLCAAPVKNAGQLRHQGPPHTAPNHSETKYLNSIDWQIVHFDFHASPPLSPLSPSLCSATVKSGIDCEI